jgi:hypothetical protein
VNETEPPPPELLGFFAAERDAPRVDASARVALRDRLAASFANDALPDELRLAKRRHGELGRATAQEPVAAPPASGRTKGKMNLFDKRIIGAATLIAAAIGLIGVTVYKRHVDAPAPERQDHGPTVDLGRSSAMTPRFSPVAPTTGADLAITAGESAWIHAPFGAVDIEIQSQCDAEVELSRAANVLWVRETERGDASAFSTKSSGSIIAGTDSPDGRASTYHLKPGVDLSVDLIDGIYEYTSRCAGQPPKTGNIVVDRLDISEPLGASARPMTPSWFTNARVYERVDDERLNEDARIFQAPFDSLLANLMDLVGSAHAKSVFVLDDKRSVVPGGYVSQRAGTEAIAFREWFEREIAPKLDRGAPNVLNRYYGTWGDKDYSFSFVKKQSGDRTYYVVIEEDMTKHAVHVVGTVLPDARVSIGTRSVALGPADPTGSDPPSYPTFGIDVPISSEHPVVAVRVDDTNGTHFYVLQPSGACTTTMTAPKQTAAMLDAQGYHAGALSVFETVMAACKPDRRTLSLAFEYACKAGDREAARKYWRKLPVDLQRTLEPLCARNGIYREALDRP